MGDVSKTIVVVLIIATILVSVLGTWMVLSTVNKEVAKKFSNSQGYGQVSVSIVTPAKVGSGEVKVDIQNPS
ncbi:MAG: hypothetical protein ACPLXC_03275 [Candidatus Pacearchaeota archaeon]